MAFVMLRCKGRGVLVGGVDCLAELHGGAVVLEVGVHSRGLYMQDRGWLGGIRLVLDYMTNSNSSFYVIIALANRLS